jgi:transposase
MVVAPALIPKRSGERIKTNRRDAVTLARLHRAGELTGVWTPDAAHEAVRDLVRAREAATDDLRRKRQQLLSFLLRHSRIYSGGGHWTMAHRRWLANQKFEHAAQQIVFQEGRRFDTPRQLMSFLGLVPAERSTGDTIRRKGLTLAGNRRARRAPERVTRDGRIRIEQPPTIGLAAAPPGAWVVPSEKRRGLTPRHVDSADGD